MDLKKGLSFIAFGFLLTLVNLNLNFQDRSINVMPAFVGWFLMFLAIDKLGSYAEDRKYLKWLALVMVLLTGASYALGFARPGQALTVLQMIDPVLGAVYIYILIGALERVAHDYNIEQESTLRVMKAMNLGIILSTLVLALLLRVVTNSSALMMMAIIALILGIAALFIAIALAVTLFRLRKAVIRQM